MSPPTEPNSKGVLTSTIPNQLWRERLLTYGSAILSRLPWLLGPLEYLVREARKRQRQS